VSLNALKLHHAALVCSRNSQDILTFLTNHRKLLHKKLFAECSKEIMACAKLADQRKIATVLKSSSTKSLVQGLGYIPLPLAVNDIDDPEKLVCSPQAVKAMMMEYFRRLYDHSNTPMMPKPWIYALSVTDVHSRVIVDPFEWPRKASLTDF
jgi:hypothetical protein